MYLCREFTFTAFRNDDYYVIKLTVINNFFSFLHVIRFSGSSVWQLKFVYFYWMFWISIRTMLTIHSCFRCCSVVLTLSQGVFDFPLFCQWGGAEEAGRDTARTADLNLAHGTFHTMECPAWYINGGGRLAQRGQPLLGNWLDEGQQVLSSCNVHHLSFLGAVLLSFCYFHCYYYCILLYYHY